MRAEAHPVRRDLWLEAGLALSRDGELVPWLIGVCVLLVVFGVAIVARACS